MTDNKTLIAAAYAAMTTGDNTGFGAIMSQDVVWRTMARGRWNLTFHGRDSMRRDLFARLYAQFDGPLTNQALRIFADGDTVIVESEGDGTTKAGKTYNNRYAIFYRLEDGQIVEIREYLDTAFADDCLEFVFAPASHG